MNKILRIAGFVLIVLSLMSMPVIAQEATEEPDTEATEEPMVDMEATEEPMTDMEATEEPMVDMEATEESDTDTEQDAESTTETTTDEPMPLVVPDEETLEDIAADSSDFYGVAVTVQGTVSTFINAKTFVLGEDTLIDNDQVLVVNMTDVIFDLDVTSGEEVRVSGVILPSLTERNSNELVIEDYWVRPEEDTPHTDDEDMTLAEMNMASDPLAFIYDGRLQDNYDVYTILIVENVELVSSVTDTQE